MLWELISRKFRSEPSDKLKISMEPEDIIMKNINDLEIAFSSGEKIIVPSAEESFIDENSEIVENLESDVLPIESEPIDYEGVQSDTLSESIPIPDNVVPDEVYEDVEKIESRKKITMPKIKMPEIKIKIPKIPKLDIPKFELFKQKEKVESISTGIKLPRVTLPKISRKNIYSTMEKPEVIDKKLIIFSAIAIIAGLVAGYVLSLYIL